MAEELEDLETERKKELEEAKKPQQSSLTACTTPNPNALAMRMFSWTASATVFLIRL